VMFNQHDDLQFKMAASISVLITGGLILSTDLKDSFWPSSKSLVQSTMRRQHSISGAEAKTKTLTAASSFSALAS